MGSICKSAKTVQSRSYWFDRQDTNQSIIPRDYNNMKSNIKLEFTIENIEKNHKYQVGIIFAGEQPFYTETVLSQMFLITFNTCYIGSYFFEKQQHLTIKLLKDGKENGSLNTSLGGIVGSIGSVFKGYINNNVIIKISAQSLSEKASYVNCKFEAHHTSSSDNFKKPEDKISYLITSGGRKIYSSESIDLNGKFKHVKIPADLLQTGFNISFLDGYQEVIVNKNENIQQFCMSNNSIYLDTYVNNKRINLFNKSELVQDVNFIDYIKAGVMIKLSIGIDYTSSNLSPNDPKSLHYLGNNMNDYEQAIEACGLIVAYYDYNQKFPVYGYGALLNGEQQVNMCFNVNFNQDPEIYTIDNVLKEYRKSFQFLQLAGPTNFSPLIRRVVDNIKYENNPLRYHILLILTDGIINDLGKTIDVLVEGSFLPLSVIIIGIGNDHFSEMVVLDGDVNPLIDSRGVRRMRDLVQFVPFNRFRNNPTKLAEEVLEEVPRQVIEYYTINKLYPNNLHMANHINAQSTILNNISQTYYDNLRNPQYDSNINNQYNVLNIHNK